MDYLTHERYVAALQNRIDGLKERLAYEKARNAELEKMVAKYVQLASVKSDEGSVYSWLVKRGLAQHEAFAISNGDIPEDLEKL